MLPPLAKTVRGLRRRVDRSTGRNRTTAYDLIGGRLQVAADLKGIAFQHHRAATCRLFRFGEANEQSGLRSMRPRTSIDARNVDKRPAWLAGGVATVDREMTSNGSTCDAITCSTNEAGINTAIFGEFRATDPGALCGKDKTYIYRARCELRMDHWARRHSTGEVRRELAAEKPTARKQAGHFITSGNFGYFKRSAKPILVVDRGAGPLHVAPGHSAAAKRTNPSKKSYDEFETLPGQAERELSGQTP